jgi:hypothetical protein
MRTIYLPAPQRTITLRSYVDGVKHAIANPDATFPSGLTTWWPTTGREIREQFRRSIHDRINANTPYLHRGLN